MPEAAPPILYAFDSHGVHFLPLVDGTSECHVSCAHLDPGAKIPAPSLSHATALLVVHGKVTVWADCRIQLLGGMGGVLARGEAYSLETDTGHHPHHRIRRAHRHRRGISSPDRIAGQTWPSDPKPRADCGPPGAGLL